MDRGFYQGPKGTKHSEIEEVIEAPPPPRHSIYGGGGHGVGYSQYEYGASRNHGGGGFSYSHYGGGYSSDNYVNERNPYVPPPPRTGYYVPAPQPPPPAYTHPQQPWDPEQYVPPPPVFYQSEPPQPPTPSPQPAPRTGFYPPSEDRPKDCAIM